MESIMLKQNLYHVSSKTNQAEEEEEEDEGGLITAIRNRTDNTMDNNVTITRKQKWEEKQLYGRFKRLVNNISHEKA